MVNTRQLDREDREKIWTEEIEPVFADQFITLKRRLFGELGEVVKGMPLIGFCRSQTDLMNEPVLSEYGIGVMFSIPPQPYGRHARIAPPHNAFVKTSKGFALPTYVFGIGLKDFPLSGFLTFFKILLDDNSWIRSELFNMNSYRSDIYNRNHSDFTLANMAICNELHNQGEWRFEKKKYSIDRRYASLTQNFEYDDLDELASQTYDEFEKLGEIITELEKNVPRKKLFGLF